MRLLWAIFFDTIQKNWKQSLTVGLINLVLSALLIVSAYFYIYIAEGLISFFGTSIMMMLLLIFSFMRYYIYMLLITFDYTLRQLYRNSFLLAFAGLTKNFITFLVLGLLYAIAGIVVVQYFSGIVLLLIVLLYICVFPAFRSLLIQFNIFPVVKKHIIDPYYKNHPGEGLAAKRSLNIVDEGEENEYIDEPIFQDIGITEYEEPESTMPYQYTNKEMNRLRHKRNSSRDTDDDGTI
jgi:hypothetical protein